MGWLHNVYISKQTRSEMTAAASHLSSKYTNREACEVWLKGYQEGYRNALSANDKEDAVTFQRHIIAFEKYLNRAHPLGCLPEMLCEPLPKAVYV